MTEDNSSNQIVSATIEILGKYYTIKCVESEIPALQQAAEYLNQQMLAAGKVSSEKAAVISALNTADQLLKLKQQKASFVSKLNQQLQGIEEKIEHAVQKARQTEFVYSVE